MEKEKEEKSINWFLIILDIIIGAVILLAINLIFLVDKVYAMDYIRYYNTNRVITRCEMTNTCFTLPSTYEAYEMGDSISLTTNIDLTLRIQYRSIYQYENFVVNENGLYVFLRGSSITPLTCTDSGTQSVSGSSPTTKIYNHNITCTISITGIDAYEVGLAMSVSKQGDYNYNVWYGTTIEVIKFEATTTPNTQGIESAINSGNSNIINNNNQNAQNIIDNQNRNNQAIIENQNENTNKITEAIENQNKVCETYNYTNKPIAIENASINNTGDVLLNQSNFALSEYVKLNKEKTYTLTKNGNWASGRAYCTYNENKEIIACSNYGQNLTFTITNANYIRYTIGTNLDRKITLNGEYCYDAVKEGKPWDKIFVDESSKSDYEQMEEELLDLYNDDQLDIIDLTIDTDGSEWVWARITQFLNTNQYIRIMFISILSLGIIKLVLAR